MSLPLATDFYHCSMTPRRTIEGFLRVDLHLCVVRMLPSRHFEGRVPAYMNRERPAAGR